MTEKTLHLGTSTKPDGSQVAVNLKMNALTTHACVVGATGSGKSGLIISVCEELIRNQVPIFIVDLKGDMANLALQPPELRDKMAVRFLTPGGTHGEPVNIFSGIGNPDRVSSTVSTICKMIGAETDPLKSKPHAFLSTIIKERLKANLPCTITDMMKDVAEPPFEYLGVLPVEEVLPAASRGKLMVKLNNLLAAPGFQTWREGVEINIDKLMQCATGKVPVVIFSVAHLVDDTERIFAISMFLEEMLSWMRKQPGTDRLKTCLILDEMFGVMPPHPANPPTKKPLLTMLKQARAHGLGIVICSQNPMDLDYKGMSNAQTWLVGRLQTDRDRTRVIQGICSASAQDDRAVEATIARLHPRQFLIVRPTGTAVFHSRNVTAELRGPMSPAEIKELFTLGLAEEVCTMDRLMMQLDNARAAFELDNSDKNWQAVTDAQNQIDNHNKESK